MNIIMTIIVISSNMKILLLGEFSFSITYIIAHLIAQLLIVYSIYISDIKFFEEKKQKKGTDKNERITVEIWMQP